VVAVLKFGKVVVRILDVVAQHVAAQHVAVDIYNEILYIKHKSSMIDILYFVKRLTHAVWVLAQQVEPAVLAPRAEQVAHAVEDAEARVFEA
jgi:hypothetical protein